MDDKTDPCSEGSLAVRTGAGGNVWSKVDSSCFPGVSPLHRCGCPVGLARLGAFVKEGAPFSLVLISLLPGVGVDAKHLQGYRLEYL